MTNAFDRLAGCQVIIGVAGGARTKTGLALGSAYTYASAGAALGIRFVSPVTENLTDIYFFVTAIAGTPGVTTCELRNAGATILKPGTTLRASQTVSPGVTANKYIIVHFTTPYSCTAGELLWAVFGDAGWTTGNTVTVDYISVVARNANLVPIMTSITTANGFSTDGTASNELPAMVLKFADGTEMGSPFTADASYTSNTRERGFKITGLTEDLWISGVMSASLSSNLSGIKIYQGTTAPGGATVMTASFGTGAGVATGAIYFAPFKLLKNTVYRIVFNYGGNTTAPGYSQIEDYTTSVDLTNAGVGGGSIFSTIDDGSGGWTDNIDFLPKMDLLISDQAVQPGALVNGGVLAEG